MKSGATVVGIPQRRRPTISVALIAVAALAAGAASLGVIIGILLPAVGAVRAAGHKHSCKTNLQRIGEALSQYEAEYGTLPPAFVADATGRPMHSWRVLLLPYLDEEGLSVQYNLDLPWDDPRNLQLAKSVPAVFACPADPNARSLGESNYMVIVGPSTLFPGKSSKRIRDVVDDLSTTLVVVETPAEGVPWTQPTDLTVDKMQFVINGQIGKEVGSSHPGGASVLMADGNVHFLSELLPADYLSGMSTIDGDETIPNMVLNTSGAW
jgi:prepilin-type processing-associated H-X9-DG protein